MWTLPIRFRGRRGSRRTSQLSAANAARFEKTDLFEGRGHGVRRIALLGRTQFDIAKRSLYNRNRTARVFRAMISTYPRFLDTLPLSSISGSETTRSLPSEKHTTDYRQCEPVLRCRFRIRVRVRSTRRGVLGDVLWSHSRSCKHSSLRERDFPLDVSGIDLPFLRMRIRPSITETEMRKLKMW